MWKNRRFIDKTALDNGPCLIWPLLMSPSVTLTADNRAEMACFADATYPLQLQIDNQMPRDIVLSAVPGLFLRHCALNEGRSARCTVFSYAQLQQLAWDVAQIAQLNGYRQGVSVRLIDESMPLIPPANTRLRSKKESLKSALPVKEITL